MCASASRRLALDVGLGVLPVIGGLASLWLPSGATTRTGARSPPFLGASIVTSGCTRR